jgi:hypothetical protein
MRHSSSVERNPAALRPRASRGLRRDLAQGSALRHATKARNPETVLRSASRTGRSRYRTPWPDSRRSQNPSPSTLAAVLATGWVMEQTASEAHPMNHRVLIVVLAPFAGCAATPPYGHVIPAPDPLIGCSTVAVSIHREPDGAETTTVRCADDEAPDQT